MKFKHWFAVTGAVQGWALWGLLKSAEQGVWPATQPMAYAALMFFAIAVPMAVYWTQDIEGLSPRIRGVVVAVVGLLYGSLGGSNAWVAGSERIGLDVLGGSAALTALVLGFVGIGLVCGFDFSTRRWRYARLFQYAWRNGILTITAGVMTGTVWVVLYAGAELMKLIDISWVLGLIQKQIFIFPVTGLVVAGAFALGVARATMTETIRRFWLSIASWLLLLVLFFAVVWVAAVPFTGLDALFKTQYAALMMLWFSALAVKFANCAYQDGAVTWPYPRWLSLMAQAAWLGLLPVAAIAWWALGLRVAQYGWTESRLWAALVATLALVYAVGYAWSWRNRSRWMDNIGRTNLLAAWVLCFGLITFMSPWTHVQRLAVASQMQRVHSGSAEPDWDYLRWKSGRFGQDALHVLAAGTGVPAGKTWVKQATEALAQSSRYAHTSLAVTAEDVRAKFAVYPHGKVLPDSFAEYAQSKDVNWQVQTCLTTGNTCSVWLGDMNGDGTNDIVLFDDKAKFPNAIVLTENSKGWRYAGDAVNPSGARDTPFDASQLSSAETIASEWSDLRVGALRYRFHIKD